MGTFKQVVCCLAVLAVFLLCAQNVRGAIQWPVADGGNGHYYEFVYAHLLWPDAKVAAEAMTYLGVTGHLVTITSPEENNFVFQLDSISDPNVFTTVAWIGLTDDEAFGGYESFGQPNPSVDGGVWVTGEPVTFTDWEPPAPNNADGNEDYALLGSWGALYGWNDQAAHYGANFIVEYDVIPEPSTIILFSIGAISLLAYAWRRRR